jgi:hypothetical protein
MKENTQVRSEFEQLVGERRKTHDIQWERIARFVMPHKMDFITKRSYGDSTRGKDIYDPTAAVSMNILAAHMHTSLTSPSAPWFSLRYMDPTMDDDDTAAEWIEDCTKRMFNAINDSNFVSVINELYKDLCTFGTAALEVTFVNTPTEGFRLVFRPVHLASCVFLESIHGPVNTFFHEMELEHNKIGEMFNEKELPQDLKDKIKAKPYDKCKLLRCVKPNRDYDPKAKKSDERQFTGMWLWKSTVLREEGFYELPYMVPRWDKIVGETYGFGPGTLALPDIETLNEAKRLELRSWEKAIDPPVMGMAGGVIGDLHLEAGGFTQVRDTRAIAPLHDQANWSAVQIKSGELRQNIQAIFLIDQLILPERPNATATEVTIRYEMMQKVLGGTLGRLQSELLNPLVERVFGIMYRNGQFLDMPEEIAGAGMEVKYTGPMAKAQTSHEATAIERMFNLMLGVGQMDPTVVDAVDMTKAILSVAKQWGVPADVLRGEDEIAALQGEREQAQKQAQAQQEAGQQAAVEQQQAEATAAQVQAMELVGGRGM